jgi:eukaryotic-like serine/threonine-protein kinase
LLEETVEAAKVKLAPDHPTTLAAMNNLAAAYWSLKRLDKSIPLFEETVKLSEKKLGRQHPDTLSTIANLGVNNYDAGQLADARRLLEEAYEGSKTELSLSWVGSSLLTVYTASMARQETVKLVEELLAGGRKRIPAKSPAIAKLVTDCGVALLQVQEYAAAEPLLREVLALREEKIPESWTTAATRCQLGAAMLGQKRYDAAEPLLVKGYLDMMKQVKMIPPQSKARLSDALDSLIQLYTATEKPAELKKYRALRAAYSRELAPPPRAIR